MPEWEGPTFEKALVSTPIDPIECRRNLPSAPQCGGFATFEGLIRNHNAGRQVLRLEYEAYDALAHRELQRIADEAFERFGVDFIRVLHRVGTVHIGDTAVVIQVLAKHRDEAFRACRFLIDELKHRVPIWKKEFYADAPPAWTRCTHHDSSMSHL